MTKLEKHNYSCEGSDLVVKGWYDGTAYSMGDAPLFTLEEGHKIVEDYNDADNLFYDSSKHVFVLEDEVIMAEKIQTSEGELELFRLGEGWTWSRVD